MTNYFLTRGRNQETTSGCYNHARDIPFDWYHCIVVAKMMVGKTVEINEVTERKISAWKLKVRENKETFQLEKKFSDNLKEDKKVKKRNCNLVKSV